MVLLRADPGNPQFLAELIDACKVNQVYDKQCEYGRAPYLYRLIVVTGHVDSLYQELSRCLFAAHEGRDEIDTAQIFGILCQAAAEDRKFDRGALRSFLLDAEFENVPRHCIDAFIGLEGVEGVLFWVRRFYQPLSRTSATKEAGYLNR